MFLFNKVLKIVKVVVSAIILLGYSFSLENVAHDKSAINLSTYVYENLWGVKSFVDTATSVSGIVSNSRAGDFMRATSQRHETQDKVDKPIYVKNWVNFIMDNKDAKCTDICLEIANAARQNKNLGNILRTATTYGFTFGISYLAIDYLCPFFVKLAIPVVVSIGAGVFYSALDPIGNTSYRDPDKKNI
jgi:hypothetical protein